MSQRNDATTNEYNAGKQPEMKQLKSEVKEKQWWLKMYPPQQVSFNQNYQTYPSSYSITMS